MRVDSGQGKDKIGTFMAGGVSIAMFFLIRNMILYSKYLKNVPIFFIFNTIF